MEDRSQLPPDLPIQLPPSPLGDKYNVILALPSRMRQALMAVFHTSSFGLLIKPPEEDCSRIGQTFSSHTGRTSGLPFCSVNGVQVPCRRFTLMGSKIHENNYQSKARAS